MKYAIITQIKFWEKRQGCDHVINNRFEYLSGDKILIYVGKLNKKEIDIIRGMNIKLYIVNPFSFNLFRTIRFVLAKVHFNIFYFFKKPFGFTFFTKDKIKKICLREKIDTIIVEYVWLANMVNKLPGKIVKIIDTHDIQAQFCELFRKTNKDWKIAVKPQDEIKLYKKFDIVIALSRSDKEYFDQYLTNVYYLPLTYNKKSFQQIAKDRLSIGFIGGSARFNFDAIDWFVSNVFPSLTNVELNIYGMVCKQLTYDMKGVNVIGPVENLDDVYQENHIMINPTFIIGGIKTKNVEALSYGKIVLTTSFGARGLERFVNTGFIKVADSPEDTIKIIKNYQKDIDLFNRIGTKVINEFEKEFGKENNQLFENEIIKKHKEKK